MVTNGVNGTGNFSANGLPYKRTILITGATDGVGKQLAREFINNKDNFVILHGRCERKCLGTLEELASDRYAYNGSTVSLGTGHDVKENGVRPPFPTNATYINADFSDFRQILKLIEKIKTSHSRINTIVCCAAILPTRRLQTRDGLEMQFQVNHLSHFAILNGLVPLLEANVPSRILTVGSMLHTMNAIDWDDVNCLKSYDKFQQYSRTMLMNHMMTFCLHRLFFKHHMEFRVTANVVDADQKTDRKGTRTSMSYTMNDISASDTHLCSHSSGIQTLVRLAEWEEYKHTSGKYYNAVGKEIPSLSEIRDVRLQNRMWQVSTEFTRRYGGETQVNNMV
ncbi:unnamed protein product [Bursaphelenchus xylophilus]|uniref:(pine wood nematode) hypothetical protein n=1 Tax=Bursaphelenchus xylophilus TaxID=6326 RepID=A0A1I7S5Q7_BURXY|nr:unnamed protein product [Bursaphelenchus xylophilus]CAG9124970.1 unnamed protein product [Bursaphelenchus xylophilus]